MSEIAAPTEFADFTIGGEKFRIPAITLYVLEERQADFDSIGPELSRMQTIRTILKVLAFILDEENPEEREKALRKALRFSEFDGIYASFNELLRVSGFGAGEAQAAGEVDGTGTLEPSPPNLQLTGFAPETSIGSNDPIH